MLVAVAAAAMAQLYLAKEEVRRRQERSEKTLKVARQALLEYQLFRAESPLKIAPKNVQPRLLMLPCPDNIGREIDGDRNLDGSQDPTCGARGTSTNVVNSILRRGSRFGRLPWRGGAPGGVGNRDETNDGLGRDFRDGNGDRLWYAASRNLIARAGGQPPFNLHRLATLEEGWLTAVDADGAVLNNAVAAVLLSPGKTLGGGRRPESFLLTARLSPFSQSAVNDYFESIGEWRNNNRDGVFVRAPRSDTFNDLLEYIAVDDLLAAKFARDYARLAGAGDVHNAPRRRLAVLQQALRRFYRRVGFYPTPAARTNPAHTDSYFRHCAAFESPDAPVAVVVRDASLTAANNYPAGARAELIAVNNLTVRLPPPMVFTDNDLPVAATGGRTVAVARGGRVFATLAFDIVGGETVAVPTLTISIPNRTPLSPDRFLSGWFPEHHRTTMLASADGKFFELRADTEAGFFGDAVLTASGLTITVSAADKFILSRGTELEIEKDFDDLSPFAAMIRLAAGATMTLTDIKPTRATFNKRHFAVHLAADAVRRRHSQTLRAPAIVYPWRDKTSTRTITRDNLHPYPPCLDARHFDESARAFLEDHPLHYAVARRCHTGGECAPGDITVRIDVGARVALPAAHTVTQTYTATVHAALGVVATVVAGVLQNSVLLAAGAGLPIMDGGELLGRFYFPAPVSFPAGRQLTMPAGAVFSASRPGIRFDQVRALLVFSPAPLRQVQCTTGMPGNEIALIDGVAVANQRIGGGDLTVPCMWLDREENADGDNVYQLQNIKTDKRANDYFVLFGGRLRLQ